MSAKAPVSLAAVILALAPPTLLSQQDTGTITGTVFDPAGAVMPGFAVRVINTATNIAVSLTTNQDGEFVATPLRIGAYVVEAEAAGFQENCPGRNCPAAAGPSAR